MKTGWYDSIVKNEHEGMRYVAHSTARGKYYVEVHRPPFEPITGIVCRSVVDELIALGGWVEVEYPHEPREVAPL